jgi:DNA-binding response OmpR family regulator
LAVPWALGRPRVGSIASVTDAAEPTMTVLLYSDDVDTRERVKLAVGRRPAPDVPRVEWLECATGIAVISALDKGGVDVAILDGEAAPTGGMGIARQAKDEIFQCPPIVVLTGRAADSWLANWSRAEAAVPHPLDPIELAKAVADLMRRRRAALPAS